MNLLGKILFIGAAAGLLGACSSPASDPKREKQAFNRLQLAKDFVQKGQLDAAELETKKALKSKSDFDEAYNLLGLVELRRAADNFRLLEIDDCLQGLDADALRAEMDEHLLRAEGHFARSVSISQEYGEAWANRGTVALLQEDYDKAQAYFETALNYPAKLVNAGLTRASLGWARFRLREHALAAKDLRQALQFAPRMCIAKYRLGRVYFDRKEWNKSAEQFLFVMSQTNCPIQEAYLYYLKATLKSEGKPTSDSEGRQQEGEEAPSLESAARSCIALAPKSCIAQQCQMLNR